jgi:hypothetical protein
MWLWMGMQTKMKVTEYEKAKEWINRARHSLDLAQKGMEEAGSILIGVVDRTGDKKVAELHDKIHSQLERVSLVEEFLRLTVLPELMKHKPTK